MTTIRIDEPNVADSTDGAAQLSPVLSQRRWEQEAEANILERLEAIGLLAPAGEADKVLETVLNNLVVTNNVTIQRPLHARILLTSPLESFTVGHTIVLRRRPVSSDALSHDRRNVEHAYFRPITRQKNAGARSSAYREPCRRALGGGQ